MSLLDAFLGLRRPSHTSRTTTPQWASSLPPPTQTTDPSHLRRSTSYGSEVPTGPDCCVESSTPTYSAPHLLLTGCSARPAPLLTDRVPVSPGARPEDTLPVRTQSRLSSPHTEFTRLPTTRPRPRVVPVPLYLRRDPGNDSSGVSGRRSLESGGQRPRKHGPSNPSNVVPPPTIGSGGCLRGPHPNRDKVSCCGYRTGASTSSCSSKSRWTRPPSPRSTPVTGRGWVGRVVGTVEECGDGTRPNRHGCHLGRFAVPPLGRRGSDVAPGRRGAGPGTLRPPGARPCTLSDGSYLLDTQTRPRG